MKILIINNNHFRKSGTDSVYLNLLKLLEQMGHRVIAFSFKDHQNVVEFSNEYFVDKSVFARSFGKFYSKASKKSIEKLILEHRPDLAHFHNIIGGLSFSILPVLKKYNIPVVATIHGFKYLCPAYTFIDGKGNLCPACKNGRFYNCVINRCSSQGVFKDTALAIESYFRDFFLPLDKYVDKYIFLSKFFQNKFCEFNPGIENKSKFFYNSASDFTSSYSKIKGTYFLFFGRLDREKGIKTLLKAFEIKRNLKLVIIGEGFYSSFINENKTENVEYIGYQNWDTIKEYLLKASFVIIPSECYENNPMTIIESYSLGKPVIGSNIGGIPEIIVEGETGYTFEPKNYLQLCNLLEKVEKMEIQSYEQMSLNSIKFAHAHFSESTNYEKLLAVYNSLIN